MLHTTYYMLHTLKAGTMFMSAEKAHIELVKQECGVNIYKMYGTYTVAKTEEYHEVCETVIKADDAKAILLDFAEVKEIDTAGFACVMNFIKENLKRRKKIGIINVRKKDRDLAEMLKLDGAVELFETKEEAVENLKCQE